MSATRQTFIALCFLVVAAILQGRVAHAMSVNGAAPDFLLIVLGCSAMLIGGYWGVVLGFATGYLTAALSADPFIPFGTMLVSRTIAGAFAAGLQRSVIRDSVWVPALVVAATTAISDVIYAAMAPHSWLQNPRQWFRLQGGQMIINTLLSYPFYLLLRKLGLGIPKEDPFGISS